MINRNINSLSYDKNKNKNKEQNKFSTNNIKKYKLKTYVSPKMRNQVKGIEIDSNNKNNEIQKNLLEKNMSDSLDILNEKNKIKNTDNSQSDTTFKSPEKNNIKLLIKKNYEYINDTNEKETKEENEIIEKNNSNINHNKEYIMINDFKKHYEGEEVWECWPDEAIRNYELIKGERQNDGFPQGRRRRCYSS